MKVYLGEKGLNESWQSPFKKMIKCHKCDGTARIMFVVFENSKEKECVYELHKTTGKKGGHWVHDAIACAVYLCKDCFEAIAILNQA